MTAAEIIVARSPSVVITARITTLITLATEQTGSVFGTRTTDAVALLVLHWLALGSRNAGGAGAGVGGAITSETEGQLSRSYGGGMINNNSNELASTSWGLELLRLRNTMIISVRNRTF